MKAGVRLTALILALVIVLALGSVPSSAVVSPNGSYCLDQCDVLDEKTVDLITERNYNLEANCSGAQICVVILRSTNGDSITDYAAKLFEKWAIGRSGEDNGILILMLTEDNDYLVLPGKGFENVLNAAALTEINRSHIEPYFADGDYDTAVREAFRKLNDCVCSVYGADPDGFAGGSGFTGGGSGRYGTNGIYGKRSNGLGISCNGLGTITLAACGACAGIELLSWIGGKN